VLVALAASFVVGWVLMTWLTGRIQRLRRAAGVLAAGRLDVRVDDRSRDDLGRLGRDFDRMAARLQALVEDLRGKEQFQRQLVANVSHDLRTPLASLRGYVETIGLRGQDMPAADYERYLRIVTDNVAHLDRLVDHLMQLSRLDSGQTRFALETFPLAELCEGVLARAEGAAAAKAITLACECPDDLPLVEADPLQVAQVLQNLVENGVKFGHRGGHVAVVARVTDDAHIEVAVRDDGPGIAPEMLPHIFERFYTGDESRSDKGQSSGLGLAISKKIVEGHGSTLTVESETGRGTTFRFHLAVAAAESESGPEPGAGRPRADEAEA
jgi:signal transduction histidine kinase